MFQNGDVCISILHPPIDDPQSGELPSERWNPTQNVRYNRFFLYEWHGPFFPGGSPLDLYNIYKNL